MTLDLLPSNIREKYEVHEWRHACAVMKNDFPTEWRDLLGILSNLYLTKDDFLNPGGGLSSLSQRFNKDFRERGWIEKSFDTKLVVDAKEMNSPTHKVDCVKSQIALELEWSNKDPFFDRDLNNFRLLFDLRAISVGIIVTKSDELSLIMKGLGEKIWNKYGWSSTWMKKLLPRIEGGGGGGCPILVFGFTKALYDETR